MKQINKEEVSVYESQIKLFATSQGDYIYKKPQ